MRIPNQSLVPLSSIVNNMADQESSEEIPIGIGYFGYSHCSINLIPDPEFGDSKNEELHTQVF